jgi:hypothetical protein
MDEDKKSPGRPTSPKFSKVEFVQMHDAFTPLQLPSIMTLGMKGAKAMSLLEERPHGIYVEHPSGRKFIVPYGNISFYELCLEK